MATANVEYFCPSCDRRIQNPRDVEELTCLSCKKSVQLVKKGISEKAAKRSHRRRSESGFARNRLTSRLIYRQALLFPMMGFAGLVYTGYEWFANPSSAMNFLIVIGISIAFISYGSMLFYMHQSRTNLS